MKLADYAEHDATALADLVRRGEVSPAALVDCAAEGVARLNGRLNAVIELYPDRCPATDRVLEAAPKGPLFGVPALAKDLSFAEAGRKYELGTLLAKDNLATVTSTALQRLQEAGLLVLGRSTTPAFGLTGTTESRIAGITRSPWDTKRTPGGSSGGSAAAVAAGIVPLATASDGGGSTRSPASYCGLVGLKQSRGRVSAGPDRAEGGSGLSTSFVLTRTVRDSALCLDVMQGRAPGDPYGIERPERPYVEEVERVQGPLRIAYMDEPLIAAPLSADCRDAVHASLAVLEAEGHRIERAWPVFDVEAFVLATTVVACANLAASVDALAAKLDRPIDGDTLQTTTLACYEYGKRISATRLLEALAEFNRVNRAHGAFFEDHDLLVTPTNLRPAPEIEDYYRTDPAGSVSAEDWQEAIFENDSYLAAFNTTGQPAISLPLHRTEDGIPVGVQFAARFGDEATLFRLAGLFEKSLPWAARKPPLHVSALDS